MWLINTALRRPIMVIVLVVGIALCSILAYQRMSIDIFPNLDLPVIYVAQPYGGMNPAQMESFLFLTTNITSFTSPVLSTSNRNRFKV